MKSFIVTLTAALILATGNPAAEMVDPITQWQINQQKRTENAQKAIRNKLKEYQNISEANRIYQKNHPNAAPVTTPTPDFMGTMLNAYNKPLKPENTDDTDPRNNPAQWDKIESASKICWFHKSTRKKVCEQK